jgi:hypothetical protein
MVESFNPRFCNFFFIYFLYFYRKEETNGWNFYDVDFIFYAINYAFAALIFFFYLEGFIFFLLIYSIK